MDMPTKIKEAYITRMSPQLQQQWSRLNEQEQNAILRSLARFHQVIEEETFALLEGILEAHATKT
jgi:hypothetical protein